jgi:hypothetical protein
MYFLGLILSKVISRIRIHSMVNQYQFINQGMQNEISAIIEKDIRLNGEVTLLSGQSCNCGIESNFTWHFPVLCTLLIPLFIIALLFSTGYQIPVIVIIVIASILHCRWIGG